MQWNKLVIFLNNQALAAATEILLAAGSLGNQLDDQKFVADASQPVVLTAYFAVVPDFSKKVVAIKQHLADLSQFGIDPGKLRVTVSLVDDAAWSNQWEKYYQIQHISRYLTIVPAWQKYQPQTNELVMRLDPQQSFGTGMHPTTVLALQALEQNLTAAGQTVFDVGSGSGILSIAASFWGAKQVSGFEIDPQAIKIAHKNLLLNPQVQNVLFYQSSLLQKATGKADLIVANLLAQLIFDLLSQSDQFLQPNGKLILSGVIQEKERAVEKKLQQNNFEIQQKAQIKNWVSLVAQKMN